MVEAEVILVPLNNDSDLFHHPTFAHLERITYTDNRHFSNAHVPVYKDDGIHYRYYNWISR